MIKLFSSIFLMLPLVLFSSTKSDLKKAHNLITDGYFAEADSIYISCLETATDSEKVEIYIKLAEIRNRTGDVDQSLVYLKRALRDAQGNVQTSKVKMVLGLTYINRLGKHDSGLAYLDESLMLNEDYYGLYHSNLASYYRKIHENELAIISNEKALHYFLTHPTTDTSKILADSTKIYVIYYNLAQAYKEIDRFKALDAYLKAAEYLPQRNVAKAPRVYTRIAEEYRFINDVKNAEKYEKMAIEAQQIKEEHIDGSFEKELRGKEQKAELESQRNTKLIIGGVLLVLAGFGGRILMKRKMNKN